MKAFIKKQALLIGVLMTAISQGYCASPIEVAKSIGDKLIRDTPFCNRMVVHQASNTFDGPKLIDFQRTFGNGVESIAYAYTSICTDCKQTLPVQIGHSGKCDILLNGIKIYSNVSGETLNLIYDERNIELDTLIYFPLTQGINHLLIKLNGTSDDWIFCMQPIPDKMSAKSEFKPIIKFGLNNVVNIDAKIAEISEWLVCGPFGNEIDNYPKDVLPETNIGKWDKVFTGKNMTPISWTIPHVEIVGDVINPATWGTPYNWNYHNGGTAWAMQRLSEVSGDEKYSLYADNFCNFHLNNLPYIKYQIDELKIFDCTNHHIYRTPLLDFTLAPSLPYVYKLTTSAADNVSDKWKMWVDDMIEYSRIQLRLPGSTAYTRTSPEKYTTWVDDMFMGIPFLVYASQYNEDQSLLDDAIKQIFDFNKIVWDKEACLYMHAKYSERDCRMPHWSRANGWGLWAVTEVLSNMPTNNAHYKALLKHYRRHIESIVKYQSPSGLWYNVLEYPESREEISGTAIFTMSIARGIARGWLPHNKYLPIVMKAWEAMQTKINADGSVHDICYGTMCSEDVNYYINRPFYTNDTHGLFAVLFACIEMHNLLENYNK